MQLSLFSSITSILLKIIQILLPFFNMARVKPFHLNAHSHKLRSKLFSFNNTMYQYGIICCFVFVHVMEIHLKPLEVESQNAGTAVFTTCREKLSVWGYYLFVHETMFKLKIIIFFGKWCPLRRTQSNMQLCCAHDANS